YNCDFCMTNIGKRFLIREVQEIEQDLDIARKMYGSDVKKIFFLDGNAMITPTDKLLKITNYAFEIFPHLERCGLYAHSKDILKKTDEQLKKLYEAGIKIAYVGFESGYDPLLEMIHKQASKADHINASKKLMKAGITLSATFINGLAGFNNPKISIQHAMHSADLVNKICPEDDRIWYIAFLTLMIPRGTVLFNKKRRKEFSEMSSLEILLELRAFVKLIKFQNKEANCVFRSNHASNYLPIKGILDRDKDKIISTINYGIDHPEILLAEYFRRL
ncbi:MAG: radical SAM protein, partial [Candidatus Heimdallarchaeota archaeon]